MIRGIHGLLYSSDPEATRAFFKDAVGLPGSDVGEGWWIFDFPEGDLGIHPTDDPGEAGGHDVSFYCDDIHATMANLKSRGVKFTSEAEDHGYGLVTHFTAPGGIKIQLYEPRYSKASSSAAARPRRAALQERGAARPRRAAKSKRAAAPRRTKPKAARPKNRR